MKNLIKILLVFMIIGNTFGLLLLQNNISNPIVINQTIITQEDTTFSLINLREYILQLNMKHPNVVLAQAIVESGHFNSKLFKENNNIFGMRLAKQRHCVAIGSKNGYAVYNNWKESVIDYAFYQKTYLSKLSDKQYIAAIQKRHCSDKNYTKLINQIIRQL